MLSIQNTTIIFYYNDDIAFFCEYTIYFKCKNYISMSVYTSFGIIVPLEWNNNQLKSSVSTMVVYDVDNIMYAGSIPAQSMYHIYGKYWNDEMMKDNCVICYFALCNNCCKRVLALFISYTIDICTYNKNSQYCVK